MAKQKTKLKDFFEGKRRRCRLQDFHILKDRKDILRMKMSVSMPLSNQPAEGMHERFAELYLIMAKEKSESNYSRVNVVVDNAAFHIFTTDVSSRAAIKANAAYLQNFRLVADGVDESREVALEFDAQLPVTDAEDDPLVNWVLKHLHGDFFVEAVPAQIEIPDSDPADPAPNKKKNGKQGSLAIM